MPNFNQIKPLSSDPFEMIFHWLKSSLPQCIKAAIQICASSRPVGLFVLFKTAILIFVIKVKNDHFNLGSTSISHLTITG